jgi:hypothetical protein
VIDYNGIKRDVRLDANGRVAGYVEPVTGDGWSNRRTFAVGAEAFMTAKRAGIAPAPAVNTPLDPLGVVEEEAGGWPYLGGPRQGCGN